MYMYVAGADPGFQVRGDALKKNCAEQREARNCWGISCEKSRFYAKKSYFFQLPREARKFLRYFVWKITILRQKIIFFPILGGGARRVRPPWIRPCIPYVHFCITKPLQTNIFALTKHVHRLLNPLTKTEMTSDNLQ